MDGDISQRTLSFASSYGRMIYVTRTMINLICNQTKLEAKLHSDLENFYKIDQSFRVCIVGQSSNQALSIEEDLRGRFPHLKVKRLIGIDSGMKKKGVFGRHQQDIRIDQCIYTQPCYRIRSGCNHTCKEDVWSSLFKQ